MLVIVRVRASNKNSERGMEGKREGKIGFVFQGSGENEEYVGSRRIPVPLFLRAHPLDDIVIPRTVRDASDDDFFQQA